MIQQAALALISSKWHTELLVAMVMLDRWYLWGLVDISKDVDSKVTLTINPGFFNDINVQNFTPGHADGNSYGRTSAMAKGVHMGIQR